MNPLVSIITVVYNGAATIEQTILSVLNQTYKNFEYIIIDGGSTDNTLDIVKKYEDKLSWVSEPDKGIYDAMNKGIVRASGEIIGLINSDDWYEPDTLKKVVDAYTGNMIVYGNVYYWDSATEKRKAIPKDISKIKYGMRMYHPACFVSKSVYNNIGLFNIAYKISADFDFLLRAKLNDVTFKYVDYILANMRTGGVSAVNYIDGWREEKLIFHNNGFSKFYSSLMYVLKRSRFFLFSIFTKKLN